MESVEIINKILNTNVFDKSSLNKTEKDIYKKIEKYLESLNFQKNKIMEKIPVWKSAGDILENDSIVLNFCTDDVKYDTMSYFQKFHDSLLYYIFHGKHAIYTPGTEGNMFHWTECYKNIFSYESPSEENISMCLTSINEKQKIKLIHMGSVDPELLKTILKSINEIISNNQPYILFENFLEAYDFKNKNAKYSLKDVKFNLFETKTFRVFKEYINEKNINFDVVCSTLPNDSSILLKIKA